MKTEPDSNYGFQVLANEVFLTGNVACILGFNLSDYAIAFLDGAEKELNKVSGIYMSETPVRGRVIKKDRICRYDLL